MTKFTRKGGRLFVNVTHISAVYDYKTSYSSSIIVVDGEEYVIKETCEEVLKLINDA